MALTFSLINTWDDGKRVHVSGTFGCSCCWPPAGAFVSIHYSAGRLKKFAARRNSTPQITSRDLLFHSNTKVTANSTNIAPAQTPPSSSKTQSENEASPQNQQGTDASLPAPDANAATPAPSRSNAAASASSATAPQSTAEIPAADLATLYSYVQDCRACQLQLTAAKQNASDDASKIRALTRERAAAISPPQKAAPSGSA